MTQDSSDHGVRVTVVVPCRNEAAHISTLLDALASQTRTPDEITIVNDASTDTTVEAVRAWQAARPSHTVRLVTGPGIGPAAAMNAGIQTTDADVIMRMDGHSIPAPRYLEMCLDALRHWPAPLQPDGQVPVRYEEGAGGGGGGVGVVGGVWDVRAGADTATARAIAAVVSHPLGSGGARYRSVSDREPQRASVETVPFGTFPRAVWERLGGFDESLAVNEDYDFNYRVRQAGYDVVLDRRIRATYIARSTYLALARQYFRYGFWKTQMLRKDPRAFHLRQLPPVLVAPWVLTSALAALLTTDPVVLLAAALYPLTIVVGGLHVGVTRNVNPLAAAWAIITIHLAWSAGFWRGALGR